MARSVDVDLRGVGYRRSRHAGTGVRILGQPGCPPHRPVIAVVGPEDGAADIARVRYSGPRALGRPALDLRTAQVIYLHHEADWHGQVLLRRPTLRRRL